MKSFTPFVVWLKEHDEVMAMRQIVRMLSFLLLLSILPGIPASAEDVCIVKDALQVSAVTTDRAYLHIQCELACPTVVTLSIRNEWGALVYQRHYGMRSGTFLSGDIHLPLKGDGCAYTVTVQTSEDAHEFTVHREMAMLTDAAVYAGGLPLAELTGGSPYKYAVVLDLDTLNEETLITPMLANGVQVGEVYFSVLDGVLTVDAAMLAKGSIDKATVYIAPDAITAKTLGTNRFTGIKTRLKRAIRLEDTPYVAVMVQLTVTYDPVTALAYTPGEAETEALEELTENWQLMQLMTANEAVG